MEINLSLHTYVLQAGVDDIKNEVEKSLRDSRRLLVRANELKNRTSSK